MQTSFNWLILLPRLSLTNKNLAMALVQAYTVRLQQSAKNKIRTWYVVFFVVFSKMYVKYSYTRIQLSRCIAKH